MTATIWKNALLFIDATLRGQNASSILRSPPPNVTNRIFAESHPMTALEAALLGAVQGLTEFLPVSSSAHLALGQRLLDAPMPGVTFEVAAHLGTTIAVLVHFRRWAFATLTAVVRGRRGPLTRLFLLILIGTLPAAAAGLLFGAAAERLFDQPLAVCIFLSITGAVLLGTFAVRAGRGRVGIRAALVTGAAQAAAILPGLSRSGLTISAALLCGVRRRRAAKFSFLLSVPAILGATLLKAFDVTALARADLLPIAIGAVVAFLTGFFALRGMLVLTARGRMPFFGFYCLLVAILGAVFLA
jgi:undecaprenyl-diphosphatase